MVRRLWLLLGGLVFFFLFAGFSFIVHKNILKQFDFNMTVRLQDHMPRRFDDFFSGLSEFGQVEPMSIVLAIIIVFFFIRKKVLAGLSAGILFIVLHLFELYGKFFVNHLPPPEFMLRTKQLVNFPEFTVRTENSYPSGHAGRALFLSSVLAVMILQNKKFSPMVKLLLCSVLLIYDVTMLVSRVYLGEHWTSDVIGGSFIGLALGLIEGGILTDTHFKSPISNDKFQLKQDKQKKQHKQMKIGKLEIGWKD